MLNQTLKSIQGGAIWPHGFGYKSLADVLGDFGQKAGRFLGRFIHCYYISLFYHYTLLTGNNQLPSVIGGEATEIKWFFGKNLGDVSSGWGEGGKMGEY